MPIIATGSWRTPALEAVHEINAAVAPEGGPTLVGVEHLRTAKLFIDKCLAHIDEEALNSEEDE